MRAPAATPLDGVDLPRNYVQCRCGGKHPVREREVRCVYCGNPCWDHHAVCPRCFSLETLERAAERALAVVTGEVEP